LADLARSISRDVSIDFMVVTSYGGGTDSSGEVRIIKDLQHSIAGIDVIVVEDIVDTGLTMSSLCKLLRSRAPHSLRVATLLDKPSRRIQPVDLDFVGFKIPDKFVVGYGLDYNEQYRNLPDIRTVEFGER
jgi:hypoxanthine phosphoribosyltransferase